MFVYIRKTNQLKSIMKQFTYEQIGDIFQIERFPTLTPMFYQGQEYQLQFDYNDENIMNVIKMNNQKIVGFFKIK